MTDTGPPDVSALYHALILDHARAPRRAALPDPCDASERGDNPLCGDRVTVAVRFADTGDRAGGQRVIADIGCRARGCAISVAAASMMSLAVIGKRAGEIEVIRGALDAMLRPGAPGGAVTGDAARGLFAGPGDDGDEDEGDEDVAALAAFAGLARVPQRIQCATLPWDALRRLLAAG